MKFIFVLALCVFPLVLWSQKPTPEDEKAVLDTEYAWCQAYLKADAAALAEIELDGFILTDPQGRAVTKEDELAELKSGSTRFIELSSHELSLRVYGDTAIVTGRTVLNAIEDKEPHQGIFQFTDTFVRQGGRWRVATEQVTRIGDTASASTKPVLRDQAWVKRHDGFVEIAKKGGIDVLFLGDSITDNWRKPEQGLPVWEKNFAPLRAANFGISGDRTQHLLWRMQNGELDGIKPRAIVLMIGTNNTGFERDKLTPRNSPEEVVAGVTAIVKGLRTRLPRAKILLLAIFPRGATADDPQRAQINRINAAIARLADGKRIHFLDIGPKFLASDGSLPKEIMPDFLHPGTKGYEIWAEAIKDPLVRLLK
jgi:lysophospholipase L1-like esterase/ketosteroid isomerase-like protein